MRKRWIIAATAVVVVLLLAVVAWGLVCDKDTAWWSAWGQWVGGVGAIAAAIAALWIAWHGWQRADAHAQAERDDRDKTQARRIWGEVRSRDHESGPENATAHNSAFLITNHSPDPVFKARITQVPGPSGVIKGRFAEPAEVPTLATIESGQHVQIEAWDLLAANVFAGFDREHGTAEDYAVTIRFMDANGLWWERTGLDEPKRIGPDGNPL